MPRMPADLSWPLIYSEPKWGGMSLRDIAVRGHVIKYRMTLGLVSQLTNATRSSSTYMGGIFRIHPL